MFSRLALYVLMLFVTGCTSGNIGLSTISEMTDSGESAVDAHPLNPSLNYLRVAIDERVVLLVLGYVDTDPNGRIESWYSAKGEVIKLQRGRIIGTVGLATDWRAVRLPVIPRWRDIPAGGFEYERERDEMPGYRFGIRDHIRVQQIPVPANAKLKVIPDDELTWFEETKIDPATKSDLPADRFAIQSKIDDDRVVYAEQCISHHLCIAWQRWPATVAADATSSNPRQ